MVYQEPLTRANGSSQVKQVDSTRHLVQCRNGGHCRPDSLVMVSRTPQNEHSSQDIHVLDCVSVRERSALRLQNLKK